jgi:YVTN family beta-propeller protein
MPFAVVFALIALGFTTSSHAASVDALGDESPRIIRAVRGQTINDLLCCFAPETTQTEIDPGELPEGDYLGCAAYTKDGSRILLTNRVTDNVTVFDRATMGVITNIGVGRYPWGIDVSSEYAVVACGFADSVYCIDLADYSIAARFPTGVQPWVVRVSPDESTAYVACDIDNVCEVFDLNTLSHKLTVTGFPIALSMFSWTSENGRNSFVFTDFEVTPDGKHLIAGGLTDSLLFLNTTTGAVDYVVPNITSCMNVELSGNDSVVVALSNTSPLVIHRIDLSSHTETGTVTLTGYGFGMTADVAVNEDGSKAFVSVDNNSSAIVRFATSDFKVFTQTYSPFWIGTSPDHSLAISGQYYFSIVDLAAESVLGQYGGNAQNVGAVSPVGFSAVGFDPMRHEGPYFYDYSTPASPVYLGTTDSGLHPEGDAPRRVAITPDGKKAVVTNVLSNNATIVDLTACSVEALLPIGDRVQDLAITSDSRWAVVCGFNSNSVKILDLAADSVVSDVPTNLRPGVISISPDDAYAYAGNIQGNTVSVIKLDSSASFMAADIPCGEIGVVWAAYGVSSDVKVSPTGEYVLVATSFDDVVKVIDTGTTAVVASFAVGDFPLQIAFDATGEYAIVTNYMASSYSVIHVRGDSSSVVGTFPAGSNTYPMRLAYNPIADQIGIGLYSGLQVLNVDPQSGALDHTDSYTAYGSLIQLEFDEKGEPIVLTGTVGSIPGHIHRGGQAIELPAAPSYFDYSPAASKACVVMPGPDYISVIHWVDTGAEEIVSIPLSSPCLLEVPRPNPFDCETEIAFSLQDERDVNLSVYDLAGRCVVKLASGLFDRGQHRFTWKGTDADGRRVASGTCFLRLKSDGFSSTRRITYFR